MGRPLDAWPVRATRIKRARGELSVPMSCTFALHRGLRQLERYRERAYSRRVRRLTPADLAKWKQRLYQGEQLDAAAVRHLIAEVEALNEQLARQRVEIAKKAAAALEKRLADVAAYGSGGGCPKCHDAEARAFLAKLKRISATSDE